MIQEATTWVSCCAGEEALKHFDADGSPIRVGKIKLTVRGRDPKEHQTWYGLVQIEGDIRQRTRGRRIDCPLRHQARIIRGVTTGVASADIQTVGDWVGSIATAKEDSLEYALPVLEGPTPPWWPVSTGT